MLLRNGVVRSRKPPTAQYPYGYARDQFVWSLISAVAIFCLGAGVSAYHGIQGILQPHPLTHLHWSLAVTGGAAHAHEQQACCTAFDGIAPLLRRPKAQFDLWSPLFESP